MLLWCDAQWAANQLQPVKQPRNLLPCCMAGLTDKGIAVLTTERVVMGGNQHPTTAHWPSTRTDTLVHAQARDRNADLTYPCQAFSALCSTKLGVAMPWQCRSLGLPCLRCAFLLPSLPIFPKPFGSVRCLAAWNLCLGQPGLHLRPRCEPHVNLWHVDMLSLCNKCPATLVGCRRRLNVITPFTFAVQRALLRHLLSRYLCMHGLPTKLAAYLGQYMLISEPVYQSCDCLHQQY